MRRIISLAIDVHFRIFVFRTEYSFMDLLARHFKDRNEYIKQLKEAASSDISSIDGFDVELYCQLKEHPEGTVFKSFNESLTSQQRQALFLLDVYYPFIRAMSVHRAWFTSGRTIDFETKTIVGGGMFDSEQLFEYLVSLPDYIQHRLIETNIVSSVQRRIMKDALQNHSLGTFESVIEKEPNFGTYLGYMKSCDSSLVGKAYNEFGPQKAIYEDYRRHIPSTVSKEDTPETQLSQKWAEIIKKDLDGIPDLPTVEEAKNVCIIFLSLLSIYDQTLSEEEQLVFNTFCDNPFFPEIKTGVGEKMHSWAQQIVDYLSSMDIPSDDSANSPSTQLPEVLPFTLPDDLFISDNFPIDQKNDAAHFIPDYDIQKQGGIKFAELINTISSYGYIESSYRSKRLLTYVLTGRFKPEDYQEGEKVEWIDSGYGYELIYVIKYIIGNEKGKYPRICHLFSGPQWLGKGDFKDQADYASTTFRKALNNIYPEECKLKSITAITKGTQPKPSEWSFIPPAQNPE